MIGWPVGTSCSGASAAGELGAIAEPGVDPADKVPTQPPKRKQTNTASKKGPKANKNNEPAENAKPTRPPNPAEKSK